MAKLLKFSLKCLITNVWQGSKHTSVPVLFMFTLPDFWPVSGQYYVSLSLENTQKHHILTRSIHCDLLKNFLSFVLETSIEENTCKKKENLKVTVRYVFRYRFVIKVFHNHACFFIVYFDNITKALTTLSCFGTSKLIRVV